jgi:Flp pilus assembly pilin Flp
MHNGTVVQKFLQCALRMKRWIEDESGQDLIEYTLLLAFILLASASLISGGASATTNIWSSANSVLANAAGSSS